jgi:hypothetical protein
VGCRPGVFLRAVAALTCLAAAVPAVADNFIFDGELQFRAAGDPLCAAMAAGTFHVVIVGRSDPRGLEAFLYGEKLVHASIRGADPSRSALTFIGESGPKHEMRLRPAGAGAYVGELQAKPLLGALFSCGFADAEIKIHRVAGNDPAAFDRAAEQLRLDNRALQALGQSSLPVLEQVLAAKQSLFPADHPQLLPYYYFLGQMHFAEGTLPAALPYDRQALSVCDKNDGPDSACAGAMRVNLGNMLAANGLYSEAESTLRRALAICDKVFGPTSPLRGRALNGLSQVLI